MGDKPTLQDAYGIGSGALIMELGIPLETFYLDWKVTKFGKNATIGDFDGGDGVRFYWEIQTTCYRRGQNKLLIEVAGGNHVKWGCFDDADQPMRYYHNDAALIMEANSIARVLLEDKKK